MDLIFKEKLGANFYADCFVAYSPSEPDTSYRVKVVKPQFADEAAISYLRQRLSYIEHLEIEGVAVPEIIESSGSVLIKYAFNEQRTLSQHLTANRVLPVQKTLELGIALCECIEKRHQKTWVHKNIKPNNILYSPDSGKVVLQDDLSVVSQSQLSRLTLDPAYCNESLPYQSPEQCGRVRLDIDYRSDLYSIGCVLYHCIAGEPPFVSNNAQNIIHSHLAETPDALENQGFACPASLSTIVALLLEKQTELRYQTAVGLKKDLQTCLNKVVSHNDAVFPLKGDDFSNEIVLPSILLGRDLEKKQLLGLYAQVCRGKLGVAYVSGLSGVGKSRLMQELEIPILKQQGLFASGKYNQFSRHQPYATFTQAIGKLIRQILTETEVQLLAWKNEILETVGISGQLLFSVVPDLALLIGPQPDVAPLPPVEARNRFNDLFCRFISCLATQEHPLVLFIDDLQWCDDATLDALEQLFAYPERHPYLLLALAYRSNEVSSEHRVYQLKRMLEGRQVPVQHIELVELDRITVNEMTAYILDASPLSTTGITDMIFPTSKGNPLLVNESLRWLHQKGGLFHDSSGQWLWKEEVLSKLKLPDVIQALFSERLTPLSPGSRDILVVAALLGARFKAADLASLLDIPLSELMLHLTEVFSHRILARDESELYFTHDQIQAAVVKWPDADLAKRIHADIAALFIAQLGEKENNEGERGQKLYLIAEHLKKSRNAQASDAEKFQEARINHQAGEAAIHALAHSAADYYFAEAASICGEGAWEQQYDFMLALYKNYARSALLVGDQVRSHDTMNTALIYAKNDLDRARCIYEQTIAETSLGRVFESVALGEQCCRLLGESLPEDAKGIEAEMSRCVAILQDVDIPARYRSLSVGSNEMVMLRLTLYAELLPCYYLTGRVDLYFLAGMRSVILALEHGKNADIASSLISVSIFFHLQKAYELADQYEGLGIGEAEKSPYAFGSIRAVTQSLWLRLHHGWPLCDLQDICRANIQNSIRAGELSMTGLSYMPLIWFQLAKGEDIQALKQQIRDGLEYCEQFNISLPLEICRAIEAALLPLWGEVPSDHEEYVEQKLSQWQKELHVSALCNFYCYRGMLSYYGGDYSAAEQDLIKAEGFLAGLPSTLIERLWSVYRYLVGLHMGNNPESAAQLEQVTEWAEYGSILKPYLALMQAETMALNSRSVNELRNSYWEVIDLNHEGGCHFHEAFAYQRWGAVLEQLEHHSSHFYLNEAANLYDKCNAGFFADIVREQHHLSVMPPIGTAALAPDEGALEQRLDSQFLLEATENIMKERDYSSLLLKILSSIMERVGAKNGYIITLDDHKFNVRGHGRKAAGLETRPLNQALEVTENLCPEVARFAIRSQSAVVLGDASLSGDYCHTAAVKNYKLKSVLALPLLAQGRALGLIYLENSLISDVFSEEQVTLLEVLTSQAAIALDNSLLITHLEETQSTLIQREQNLAITLNSIGDGVIVTGSSGCVERMNPIAEKLTGWPIAEAKGKPVRSIFRIFDADTREPLLNPVDKVLSLGETVYLSNHTTLIAKGGEEYQIADSAAPIRNGDDKVLGMVLVFNDVTESYRLRKEVAESHLRLQQVMGDMHSMVATLCLKGGITFVNKKPLTLGGLSFKNVLSQRLWDSFWFNYDETIRREVKEACFLAAKGQQINQDLQMQTLDGPVWIEFGLHPVKDDDDKVNLLVWEGRDISSRKLTEKKLKDEQALQTLTLDNLADGVVVVDDRGLLRRFNASACEMFGYTNEEVMGKNVSILMEQGDASMHDSYLESYRRTSKSTILGKGRRLIAKRKNGETFPFHISVIELPELVEGKKLFVASAQDLTERELQQEMLQRSQKMEALGKLTGGIAHDYNNMLGVILGYSELLEPILAETTREQGFLQQIQHAAERGAMLTKKLLSYSRQKPSQSSSVNIGSLLLSQKEMLEKTMTARIQLQLELEEAMSPVDVNPGDLEDALLNVCINAMHAMPEGGRLSIKAKSCTILAEDEEAYQLAMGEYIVMRISDTGFGMDKLTQSKIFDPFFSTKGDQGTGLGLSQVYGFMERSHGTIKVYSELGKGSSFALYFPIAGNKNANGAEDKALRRDENLSGSETILVVDDEPALVALIKEVLEANGYTVFCAEGATKAMEIVRSQSIALVLSDIIMPGKNGYELAKEIQSYDAGIIIQLMSGFDDEHTGEGGSDALHSEQLTKPVAKQALLQRVKALLVNKKRMGSKNTVEPV